MRAYLHTYPTLVHPVDILPTTTPTSLLASLSLTGTIKNSYGSTISANSFIFDHVHDQHDLYLIATGTAASLPSTASTSSALPQTLSNYSFSDSTSYVTVRLPLPNPSNIRASFAQRSFEVLVTSGGTEFKFACPRTHGLVMPDGSSARVAKDGAAVVVKLKKLKDEVWFDLFKKKAIGDTDAM